MSEAKAKFEAAMDAFVDAVGRRTKSTVHMHQATCPCFSCETRRVSAEMHTTYAILDAEAASLRTDNKRLRRTLKLVKPRLVEFAEMLDNDGTANADVVRAVNRIDAALRTTPGGAELDPGTVEACAKLVDIDAAAHWKGANAALEAANDDDAEINESVAMWLEKLAKRIRALAASPPELAAGPAMEPPACKPGIEAYFGPCSRGTPRALCNRVSENGVAASLLVCACTCHPDAGKPFPKTEPPPAPPREPTCPGCNGEGGDDFFFVDNVCPQCGRPPKEAAKP